jgi:hypothetical protein
VAGEGQKETRMSKERAGSIIFLLFGIYGLIFSIGLPLGRWNEPGPGVFPLSLSVLLCLSGVLWFIRGEKPTGKKGTGWQETSRKLVVPLKIVGLTLAFILILHFVGYLFASMLYTFFLFFWVSRYRFGVAIGLAIVVGAGSWFFFVKLLLVQLPPGLLSL